MIQIFESILSQPEERFDVRLFDVVVVVYYVVKVGVRTTDVFPPFPMYVTTQ